jgi:hypothetical protein
MQDELAIYFNGEENAGLLLVGISLIGLAAAAVFYPTRWGLRPFAATLAVFAIIEMAIGGVLYFRTAPQVRALTDQLQSQPARFAADEALRMTRVQRNFVLIERVELAVIVAAAIIGVGLKGRPLVAGIALGFLIHASTLLAFDLIAERRGAAYLAALEKLTSRS